MHEPLLECIGKGKAYKRYECGCNMSLATSTGGWLLAAQARHVNPYDRHAFAATLEQLAKLTGAAPEQVFLYMGYRGHGYEGIGVAHVDRNGLKGAVGDRMNMILSEAGRNLHKIMKPLASAPGSLALFLAWLLELLRRRPARRSVRRSPQERVLQLRLGTLAVRSVRSRHAVSPRRPPPASVPTFVSISIAWARSAALCWLQCCARCNRLRTGTFAPTPASP